MTPLQTAALIAIGLGLCAWMTVKIRRSARRQKQAKQEFWREQEKYVKKLYTSKLLDKPRPDKPFYINEQISQECRGCGHRTDLERCPLCWTELNGGRQ